MANLIPTNIKNLLSKFTFETDIDLINENLTCTLCGKLMVDAYQTYCDCKYCRECIIRYLNEGNMQCQGGKNECQEQHLVFDRNVLPNIVLNRKVLRVVVRCPNKSCEFSSTLTDMEEHLRVCSKQSIECPYMIIGCGIGGESKDTLENHLHRDLLVHSNLLVEVINNLRNEVGGLKEEFCLNKVEMAALREKLRLKDREILERVEEEKKLRQEEREEFVELIREQRMDADTKMAKMAEDLMILRKDGETEKAESKKMRVEIATLKKEVKRVNESNVRVERRNKIIEDAESAATVARIDELARTIDCLNIGRDREGAVGELWFTVDRIAERMTTGEWFESPHLYSHINGYKLRVHVHTRYRDGEHMDVTSSVCRGEFDNLLPWPCRFTLSVAVVHKHTTQPYKTRIIEYCSSTDNKYCKKPIDADNPPYNPNEKNVAVAEFLKKQPVGLMGFYLMQNQSMNYQHDLNESSSLVSHSDIRSSGVIVDNSLLFHAVVAR